MVTTSVQSSNTGMKNKGMKKGRARSLKARKKTAEAVSSQLLRQGREAVHSAYDIAAKAGSYMPHLPKNSKSVYSMMEERPLVMGAIGLGVGMVLASLLPSMVHHRNHHNVNK